MSSADASGQHIQRWLLEQVAEQEEQHIEQLAEQVAEEQGVLLPLEDLEEEHIEEENLEDIEEEQRQGKKAESPSEPIIPCRGGCGILATNECMGTSPQLHKALRDKQAWIGAYCCGDCALRHNDCPGWNNLPSQRPHGPRCTGFVVENGNEEEDDIAVASNGWNDVMENCNEEDTIATTTLTNASVDEIPA